MTRETLISIYGNVGAEPETFTFPGKDVTYERYDPINDEVVEDQITTEEKTLVTFSIAINRKVRKGKGKKAGEEKFTRWVRCTDWNGLATAAEIHTGDRVRVRGRFRERVYEKDGEQKTAKDFIVSDLSVERRRSRNRAAEASEPAEATEAAQAANAA